MKPSDIIIMNYNIQNYDEVLSKGYDYANSLLKVKNLYVILLNYLLFYYLNQLNINKIKFDF